MLSSCIVLEFSGDQNNTILLPSRYNPVRTYFNVVLLYTLEFSGDQNNTIILPSRYNPVRPYFNVVLLYSFGIFRRPEQHDSPTQSL